MKKILIRALKGRTGHIEKNYSKKWFQYFPFSIQELKHHLGGGARILKNGGIQI